MSRKTIHHRNPVFRRLLAFDLGLMVGKDWDIEGMILAEDWGGFASSPLRAKLSPKGRELYESLLKELRCRNIGEHKNLGQVSRRARKLLKESDSPDCLTKEGRALLREEARASRVINRALERFQKLDAERPGLPCSIAGKLATLFAAIDRIRRSLRTLPRFSKRRS
jgi:hypothetical protein